MTRVAKAAMRQEANVRTAPESGHPVSLFSKGCLRPIADPPKNSALRSGLVITTSASGRGWKMLPLIVASCGLLFTAERYKHLPLGRALHDMLIDRPADWLMRTPPRRLFILLVLLIGAALVWMEIGPLLMASDFAPVLWFADMSLYLDALLMVGVALAAVQVRSVGRLLNSSIRRFVRPFRKRARARAFGPRRPKRLPPANDDAPDVAIRRAA